MRTAPQSSLTGQAGVWAVAAQLAVRGLNPHFPGVDYGYDLMVDGGIRIQVKAARKRCSNSGYPLGAYWFKLWNQSVALSNKAIRKGSPRDYSGVADFIVFWGIDENRFWIVPAALVSKTCGIIVGPDGFYKRSDFAETKALVAAGLSVKDIAERLGLTPQAVAYQIRGGRTRRPRTTVVAQVRELEGRWDLITGALAMLRSAETVTSSHQPDIDPVLVGD